MSLPKHWQSVPLGTVATFAPKKPLHLKDSDEPCSFIPMASVEEESGVIHLDQTIEIREGLKRSLTYFNEGDVLFAKVTPCMENGKIAVAKNLLNSCGFGSSEFHVITPEATLDADYLRYFLVSEDFRTNAAMAMTGAVGLRRVPKTYLQEHLIPLPPLDEQRRIVETLDDQLSRLDRALAEFSNARATLMLFERAILHESFTSASVDAEMVDFKDFFGVLNPKFEGYKQKDYQTEGTLPIIDQGSALIGGYVNEMTRRIEVQKPLVIFGDHTRCVKYVDFPFAIGADGTKMLEPTAEVDSRFAYWQLRGTELRNRGYARHMGELRKVRFWLPELSIQNEIIQKVEKAFESADQIRTHLTDQERAVDVMRRALLHAAFSGKMKGLKSNG